MDNSKKKLLFLTGTRADFGKQKSLIMAADKDDDFEVHVFVTGMHMEPKYGGTKSEVEKCSFKNVYAYINQRPYDSMDTILANTVKGFGDYVCALRPDMVIVHGDRVEALAGAIVGALNNMLVVHIEGGEVSGTIDESIRHSVSKLSHIHMVANEEAKRLLLRMGEKESSIYVIGSPDTDVMVSPDLPSLDVVKRYYNISFEKYAIFIYHPVTTSLHNLMDNIQNVIKALVESGENYVVIYPNNDPGSDIIIEEIEANRNNPGFRIFPSIRFEYFLVLLKNCKFIIGNSSSGIREAPFYSVPSINIGTRQNCRFMYDMIMNIDESTEVILEAIERVKDVKRTVSTHFGDGKSTERFLQSIKSPDIWDIKIQKFFVDNGHFSK
ncbi:MAG: UDP-N-acetylglucosamine 2-epimerase (hydrolyzing) [Planctomycetes bacterium]|nr:UDP-N-acetylglucosamine 2-epimerase (hydrolyzing) [Planctomycetota bacterium]